MCKKVRNFFFLLLGFCLTLSLLFAESSRERAYSLLRQDPNSISGNIAMGISLLDENNIDGAKQYLEKVVVLKRDIPFVWYLLALVYEKKEDKSKAIDAWENVIHYLPDTDSEKAQRLKLLAEKHLKWLREKQ